MKINHIVGAAVAMMIAQSASAAVIGSLDQSRAYSFTPRGGSVVNQALNGNAYSNLYNHLGSTGSTFAAGATTVTADYLSGVNLFITGTPTLNTKTAGRASAAEQGALADWVAKGGVAVIIGELGTAFGQTANTWLAPFGLSIAGNYGRGTGRWTNSENPLLDGVNDSPLNVVSLNSGGAFAASGAYDVLARYDTSATDGAVAIVGMKWGNGYVIASGDAAPFTNDGFSAFDTDGVTPSGTANFISNIVEMADVPAPVPVPAALPLLAAGLGALGLLRRRNRG